MVTLLYSCTTWKKKTRVLKEAAMEIGSEARKIQCSIIENRFFENQPPND